MYAKRSRCENELHEITPAGQFKLPIPVQLRFIDNDAGEKRPTSEYNFCAASRFSRAQMEPLGACQEEALMPFRSRFPPFPIARRSITRKGVPLARFG